MTLLQLNPKTALKYFLPLGLWLAVFIPIIPGMIQTWISHSNNSHGLLVPFISAYFLFKKRDEIDTASHGVYAASILLSLSLVIYLLSLSGGIMFFARLMMPASLIGLAWAMFGTETLKKILFPLLFLFFMIPVPDSILNMVSLPLQMLATDISAVIMRSVSIPVYQEGNLLYFAQTQLEVAEACSGIQSIMALSMLSVILVYISDLKKVRSALLLLCAVPIAFIANILRVSATGILAHFFGDDIARSFLHDLSGIIVFIFGFLLLYVLFKVLAGEKAAIS